MPLTKTQIERYKRHILLKEIGGQGQQKLLDAKVLVIGAGGLGSPILLYLAAAGIGTLGICDDDQVALSNLQRQIIHNTDHIGIDKIKSATASISLLNPDTKITPHNFKVTNDNALALVSGYDLVVEGVDNFATRYVLNTACIKAKTPFISAAVGRFDGQISTFKPWLQPGKLPCYRCLVPQEPPQNDQVNCETEGVLGAVTGVVGTLAAMEVIKEITDLGTGLVGRLLIYDGLEISMRTLKLPADPACPDCSEI